MVDGDLIFHTYQFLELSFYKGKIITSIIDEPGLLPCMTLHNWVRDIEG